MKNLKEITREVYRGIKKSARKHSLIGALGAGLALFSFNSSSARASMLEVHSFAQILSDPDGYGQSITDNETFTVNKQMPQKNYQFGFGKPVYNKSTGEYLGHAIVGDAGNFSWNKNHVGGNYKGDFTTNNPWDNQYVLVFKEKPRANSKGEMGIFCVEDTDEDSIIGYFDEQTSMFYPEKSDKFFYNRNDFVINNIRGDLKQLPMFVNKTQLLPPIDISPNYIIGDANNDRKVNDDDLSIVLSNWQSLDGDAYGRGDFNNSYSVNDDDLSLLLSNWTSSGSGNLNSRAIPEPSSLGILGLSALGVFGLSGLRRGKR